MLTVDKFNYEAISNERNFLIIIATETEDHLPTNNWESDSSHFTFMEFLIAKCLEENCLPPQQPAYLSNIVAAKRFSL